MAEVQLNMASSSQPLGSRRGNQKVESGEKSYHIIEVMACPGGCIGGGGQPMPGYFEIRQKRAKALYNVDKEQMLRRPGDNPALQAMYEAELEGNLEAIKHMSFYTPLITGTEVYL